jgi:hypothetical protein
MRVGSSRVLRAAGLRAPRFCSSPTATRRTARRTRMRSCSTSPRGCLRRRTACRCAALRCPSALCRSRTLSSRRSPPYARVPSCCAVGRSPRPPAPRRPDRCARAAVRPCVIGWSAARTSPHCGDWASARVPWASRGQSRAATLCSARTAVTGAHVRVRQRARRRPADGARAARRRPVGRAAAPACAPVLRGSRVL